MSKLLVKYRFLKTSFENETIIDHNFVNLGVAVDIEKVLMVSNVKGIDKMTLQEVAKETEQLIGRGFKLCINNLNELKMF